MNFVNLQVSCKSDQVFTTIPGDDRMFAYHILEIFHITWPRSIDLFAYLQDLNTVVH